MSTLIYPYVADSLNGIRVEDDRKTPLPMAVI